jgi:hypothetical protein
MDHESIFKKVLISIGVLVVGGVASSYAYDFYTTNGRLLPLSREYWECRICVLPPGGHVDWHAGG